MRFVSIPTNGSSWQEPLVYSFETEDALPADILVEIRDIGSNSVLATKRQNTSSQRRWSTPPSAAR